MGSPGPVDGPVACGWPRPLIEPFPWLHIPMLCGFHSRRMSTAHQNTCSSEFRRPVLALRGFVLQNRTQVRSNVFSIDSRLAVFRSGGLPVGSSSRFGRACGGSLRMVPGMPGQCSTRRCRALHLPEVHPRARPVRSSGVVRGRSVVVRERSSGAVSSRACAGAFGRSPRRGGGVIGAAGSDEKVSARRTCGRFGAARYSCGEEPSGRSADRRSRCSDGSEWPALGAVLVFVALAVVLLGLFGGGGALHVAERLEVVSVR